MFQLQLKAFTVGSSRPGFLVVVGEGFDQAVFAGEDFNSFTIIAEISAILSGYPAWINARVAGEECVLVFNQK